MKTSPARPGHHLLYLGDWAFHAGPVFVDTPFGNEPRTSEMHFYGSEVVAAIESLAEVTCMADWQLSRLEPGRFEQILERSRGLIISDVQARYFHSYPTFIDRSQRKHQVITFPDRFEAIKNWVKAGGGLMMFGGWASFTGREGRGGWGRSRLADILPVRCLPADDLMESSEGFNVEITCDEHPVVHDLPWHSFPPLLGYNEIVATARGEVLARVRETGHPFLVAGRYGRGRILIYASDPAPYWGLNFQTWEGYRPFWKQAAAWAMRCDRPAQSMTRTRH